MSFLLENKTAIITGSNRGIGKSILELFCEHKADIFACARKKSQEFEQILDNLSKKYNVFIKPIYFDLKNQDEIVSAVKEIRSYKKNIDVLVNNAGILHENRTFLMTPIESLREIIEVNFVSQMYFTQLIARLMQKNNKGSILYISSIAGIDGFFSGYDYGVSKASINFSVIQQSKELGKSNIRVNAIAPGMINTDMIKYQDKEKLDELLYGINLGRFAEPIEVANTALFLSCDLSTYITGQIIRVDGGTTPPRARW